MPGCRSKSGRRLRLPSLHRPRCAGAVAGRADNAGEAFFGQAAALYLSSWYPKAYLAKRLGLYIVGGTVAGAFSGLIGPSSRHRPILILQRSASSTSTAPSRNGASSSSSRACPPWCSPSSSSSFCPTGPRSRATSRRTSERCCSRCSTSPTRTTSAPLASTGPV